MTFNNVRRCRARWTYLLPQTAVSLDRWLAKKQTQRAFTVFLNQSGAFEGEVHSRCLSFPLWHFSRRRETPDIGNRESFGFSTLHFKADLFVLFVGFLCDGSALWIVSAAGPLCS